MDKNHKLWYNTKKLVGLVMSKIKKYIPYDCHFTIYDVDFDKIYALGKRIMLLDIDNTLLPYDMLDADEKLHQFVFRMKKIGFEIILVSNNNRTRVERISKQLDIKGFWRAFKPFSFKYRKIMKMYKCKASEMIAVGDQLMTDVAGAQKIGIDCILVKTIKKSTEKWYTKINRKRERKIIQMIKSIDNEKYQKLIKIGE